MYQMFETKKSKIKGVYKYIGVYESWMLTKKDKKSQMTSSRLFKVGQTGFYWYIRC